MCPSSGVPSFEQAGIETNSAPIVRTMFFLYSVLIVGGIVFFVTIGLTQQ